MSSSYQVAETERLSELHSYAVLDTAMEGAFDDLTKLAAHICGTPISLVSLVDSGRIWFKSKVGIAACEIPRIDGFCSSAILSDGLLVVPDASANERLASHPLVTLDPRLRFYAGAPLTTPRGHRIGTLCVIDTVPRQLNAEQTGALESLARTVVTQLELRRTVKNYAEAQQLLLDLQTQTETRVRERTSELALSNESLRTLSGLIIKAQDDERRRIARDLHDSTGQVLAALSMTLTQMQKDSSTANLRRFEECRELIASATAEIRNLSYLLHPPLMDVVGLSSAVVEYAEGFEKRSGIRVQVEVSPEIGRLEETREIALFRIIQESLGNIQRHSGSAVADIKIFCVGQDVVLEIHDQGRGLPVGREETVKYGVGIRSMEERLRPFDGRLQIESNSSGTTVRAVLPRESSSGSALEQTA